MRTTDGFYAAASYFNPTDSIAAAILCERLSLCTDLVLENVGNFKLDRHLTSPNFVCRGPACGEAWECIWLASISMHRWSWMDYDECRPRCVMIPKRSQQKLRMDQHVGISYHLRSWISKSSSNMFRGHGCHRNVACACEIMPQTSFGLYQCQKTVKVLSDWGTVIPATASFGKRVFHHNRCVQKSQIQFECWHHRCHLPSARKSTLV